MLSHKEMKRENIRVVIRVRPLNKKEESMQSELAGQWSLCSFRIRQLHRLDDTVQSFCRLTHWFDGHLVRSSVYSKNNRNFCFMFILSGDLGDPGDITVAKKNNTNAMMRLGLI